MAHKEVKIKSSIRKLHGYEPEGDYFLIIKSGIKDTFISNVNIKSHNDKVKVNILFEGKPKETPVELLEDLLAGHDTSDNPLRPFRWYRNGECANTNDPENIKIIRDNNFNELLYEIEKPDKIWIYEL